MDLNNNDSELVSQRKVNDFVILTLRKGAKEIQSGCEGGPLEGSSVITTNIRGGEK